MPRAAAPDSTKPFAVPVGRGVSLRAAIGEHGLGATMAMGRDLPVRRSASRWTGSHSRDAPPSWRYGRDRSRLVVLAAERCRRLEARPTHHRLCLLHQLRDRAAVRVARGSHPRGSPGRVWGHLRGDRATTRRRGRRPRAAPPAARGPRIGSTSPRAIAVWGLWPLHEQIPRSHEGGVVGHALGAKRVALGPLSRGRHGLASRAPHDEVGIPALGFTRIDLHTDCWRSQRTHPGPQVGGFTARGSDSCRHGVRCCAARQ